MDRHIKAKANGKYQEIVSPGTMRFLDFARLHLRSGEKHAAEKRIRGYECESSLQEGQASLEDICQQICFRSDMKWFAWTV